MKLRVEKVDRMTHDLVCRIIEGPSQYGPNELCHVDFLDSDQNRLVGRVIEIPDDTRVYRPVFLPEPAILKEVLDAQQDHG